MRIIYYVFPDDTPIRECFQAWKEVTGDPRDASKVSDEILAKGFKREQSCSITTAKKLLRKCGGTAFTQHFERDGGLFETTPINLKGNNSKFTYNKHL